METLFYTMMPLAATGFAWVAYRHPAEYGKVSGVIILLGLAVLVGIAGFSIGWNSAVARVEDQATDIPKAMPEYLWLILYWTMGVIAYLHLLQLLPIIGIKHKPD
ncbi:divalent metal cation (Fe/Co/Zn/Cd) transporter [Devosia subaequoris]|uniref:Divalent metal cation (Fe/Co/Zn/Cd) transporter n=1 Tax=Devosia subaequoris TaxID=395930 RepID=A0A7W6NCE0_9HYPH|nr:hypothetical protein [Devosia subaequoris]MBB4053544.1 divalent metal cation (Fe/Co/Zn/Cd) transporter [Devosia subaequoris]MCP1211282.1 hypothetical protein [Devosia subaequoris]